jgi:hypothetical protein
MNLGAPMATRVLRATSLILGMGLALLTRSVGAESARASTSAAPSDMKLFLLIGQSNMAGRGPVEASDKVPHPRVFMLTKELAWVPAVDPMHFDRPEIIGVGPGASFGRAVADADPKITVGLIPAAVGGTSLDQWKIGGELYTNAIARAHAALAHGKLAGILWHQGESDNTAEKAATYTERFRTMIAQLRKDLHAEDVPLLVGELGRFRESNEVVNKVLVTLPSQVPLCAFVSAEGLKDKGDQLHFDSASQREFGRRYAQAWFGLVKAK